MNVKIREIGNSKGIIIPTKALKEAGIEKMADIRVEGDCIILKAVKCPRSDWLDAIRQDPPQDNEPVFMDGVDDSDLLEEWTW